MFELNLDNLVVSMPKLSSRSSFTTSSAVASIAKQLTIRNMSIHMDSIVKPVNQRDIIILWEKPQYSYQEVVRLFDWTVVLQCCKESRSAASFNFSAFGLECSCTSIDISISLQQLLLIKNALEFAAMERRRLRLQSIRKDMLNWSSGDSSKSNFDPRSVWDYAIKAVLLVVREERNRSFGHMQHMQASIAKLVDRRKYIVLYRKKMDILLASYANNLFPTMILEDLPEGISAELTVQESKLSISELLEYRSVVNKQLLREAVDPSILVHIIMLAYPAVRKKFPNAEIAGMKSSELCF